ncbi:hypothetical protein [Paraurantiacibacter namhicola]|uniref:Phage shock protein B n=1 Tax=Paraurantiacibacter namhicola TaxID=645517 RepID=A0A1C7DAG5_9SPHN|nr:hypothetical protein [Paraurantiacibacter namhicola]ANU08489.1 hypothetical protein A6F65_02204 [Paraurantiacibacter namhicola]
MSLYTMIFVIVLLGMAYAFWHRHTELKQGVIRDDHGNIVKLDDSEKAALQEEVMELRERVKVLERIATDDRGAKALSAEIEQLRDRREEKDDAR